MYKRIISELQDMILYKYDNYIRCKYNNDIICDYNNMIIAQYGKRKICNLLKNGYYIISRSVVPCQILRISSQLLRWVYCAIIWDIKKWIAPYVVLGIAKHP